MVKLSQVLDRYLQYPSTSRDFYFLRLWKHQVENTDVKNCEKAFCLEIFKTLSLV